jgi:acetate---CoA ligase (ADP-forming)
MGTVRRHLQEEVMKKASIDPFFRPKSIAVVGASGEKKGSFADLVLWNLRNFGVSVPVMAIHPRHKSVGGFPCLPSLSSMSERPDLCIIGVRRQSVQPVLEECVRLGVPAVTIVATGFVEQHTDEGLMLQDGLARVHGSSDVTRIIGPNTIGVSSFATHTVSTATGNMPAIVPEGQVAIVSKSGGISTALLTRGIAMGLGFCYKVAVGNEMDVRFGEVLQYYADREEARIIICHMEGVSDLQDLRQGVEACISKGKPVIFIKGGVTSAGSRAAASHTGRLTGEGAIWRGIAAQLGVIEASSIDHALVTALLFSKFGPSHGKTVGGMGLGGGLTVILADMFSRGGLFAPIPSPDTQAKMREALPTVAPNNPFDTGGVYLGGDGTELPRALRALAEDAAIGAIVILATATQRDRTDVIIPAIISATSNLPKPVVILSYDVPGCRAHSMLRDAGLLVIEAPDTGIHAVKTWLEYAFPDTSTREAVDSVRGTAADSLKVRSSIAATAIARLNQSMAAGDAAILEDVGKELLGLYGVGYPPERSVADKGAAVSAAEELGFPVALKLLSQKMLHRGIGTGVFLNLRNAVDVDSACHNLEATSSKLPDARLLVQKMANQGAEFLIGAVRDPEFGLVMAIGTGGSDVESRKDTQFCALPVTDSELRRLLSGASALRGAGLENYDFEALLAAASGIARFLQDAGDYIDELDVNPMIVGKLGEGAVAVDALLILRSPTIAAGSNS